MTTRKAGKAPGSAPQSQVASRGKNEPDRRQYSDADLEQVAAALGVPARDVKRFRCDLEGAALWYRLGKKRPVRTSPALQELRAKTIGKAAQKLLTHLGVSDPAEAEDGPGDMEIAELLGTLDGNPDAVGEATARIGRLVEVCDAIEAAAALHRRAENGAKVARGIGDLTVRKGHAGNDVLNDWIAAMMGIYRRITGKEPGTSVGSGSKEGVPDGPLIRFLSAAGEPLGITQSPHAWRERIKRIKRSASQKK